MVIRGIKQDDAKPSHLDGIQLCSIPLGPLRKFRLGLCTGREQGEGEKGGA